VNTLSRVRVPGRIAAVVVGLTLAHVSFAAADLRIVTTEGSSVEGDASALPDAMRKAFGQNDPKQVTLWIGDDRSARVGEDVTMIVRLDRKEMYTLDNGDRTYRVSPLGAGRSPGPGQAPWRIVKSAETRQVGEWTAVRHDLTIDMGGAPMDVTLWVSDVGVDTKTMRPFIEAFASSQGMDWMKAYNELDGYPVRQEVRMGPVMSWQEVVSITQEPAPPGTYDAPAGYRKRH